MKRAGLGFIGTRTIIPSRVNTKASLKVASSTVVALQLHHDPGCISTYFVIPKHSFRAALSIHTIGTSKHKTKQLSSICSMMPVCKIEVSAIQCLISYSFGGPEAMPNGIPKATGSRADPGRLNPSPKIPKP